MESCQDALHQELWADAKGLYQVSSFGRVKGPKGIMTPSKTAKGYLRVCLSIDGKQVEEKVHRLVAEAFIANPDDLPQVNHIDGNKENNRAENLEWCTNQQNMIHCRQVLKIGVRELIAFNDFETVRFPSGKAAERAGHNAGEIFRCLNNKGCRHHGFEWAYAEEPAGQEGGAA